MDAFEPYAILASAQNHGMKCENTTILGTDPEPTRDLHFCSFQCYNAIKTGLSCTIMVTSYGLTRVFDYDSIGNITNEITAAFTNT